MKPSPCRCRWLVGILVAMTLFTASALQLQFLSFKPDGTLTWTNDQTNIYCSFQFTPQLGQAWSSAPGPYMNLLLTQYCNSIVLPLPTIESNYAQCFFRAAISTNPISRPAIYDVNSNGLPLLVQSDYIDLTHITAISRFRSGMGHDYSDDFEHCRSMKHYFIIDPAVDGSQVGIFAPVTGTIANEFAETTPDSGTQVWITPTHWPAFTFILFHVNVTNALPIGATVTNGESIGWFGGEPAGVTSSDIAIQVQTPGGMKLLSYFDLMPTNIFANYQVRGVTNVAEMIITAAERDADPLDCDGQTFATAGTLTNIIYLTPTGD